MSAPIRLTRLANITNLRELRDNLEGALQRKGISAAGLHAVATGVNPRMEAIVPGKVQPEGSGALPWRECAGRLIEITATATPGRVHADAGSAEQRPSVGRAVRADATWAAAFAASLQRQGETVAWIACAEPSGGPRSSTAPRRCARDESRDETWELPFAPDLAAHGVDLSALPLVRARDGAQVLRAADVLLRSGAFALVVAEWPAGAAAPGDGPLGRLLGLCQRHEAAIAFLTDAPADDLRGGGLGSLVSLRLEVRRVAEGNRPPTLQALVRKDKRRGPGASWGDTHVAPAGIAPRPPPIRQEGDVCGGPPGPAAAPRLRLVSAGPQTKA